MRSRLLLLIALAGCSGGAPRDPYDREGEVDGPNPPPAYASEEPRRVEDDRWSIDAELPRSGDSARPNVKVEVVVLDVATERDLRVSARVTGAVVRGVVDLRGAVSGGARSARARSRTSTFIVVQAGREAQITLTDDCRGLIGPYQALWVGVSSVGPDGAVELDVAPVSPTTRPGEALALGTRVVVAPGQAVLLGGASSARDAEGRGLGRSGESSERRDLVALLRVDVLR